ncbi:Uma2 family endonuclease [Silvibacterium bohemicum]|uniref:Uma2 family endonuclease n=1 Tax=Silvibacterium bohemicum TaxID=1577686 RepID=A0A841JNQ1_9BACT|nr:Uma2 family endonuclease [Silvibacterium bohemicum]MBB6142217.1 Uma2 family endonuclease [Silvibacterium bohemicum]
MSATLTLLDYYLNETWSPDREFVNGEIVERNLGEKSHAAWQLALGRLLSNFRQSAHVRVFPELRLQTSSKNFRIPDLMVIDRDAPDEEIITHAPLLCVEILSPEDRFSKVEEKVDEYFRMGVRAVWVIDPRTQIGYQCEGARFHDWKVSSTLTVPGTPIRIEMSAVIADLD